MTALTLHAGGDGDWWIGLIWFAVLVSAATVAIVFARRRGGPGGRGGGAQAALAERFARGEIGEEEYRKGRDVLRER